jgi:hypothetical protein
MNCDLGSLRVRVLSYTYDYGIGRDWDMQYYNSLRHCANSRKVAVSIPDTVFEIFHWLH